MPTVKAEGANVVLTTDWKEQCAELKGNNIALFPVAVSSKRNTARYSGMPNGWFHYVKESFTEISNAAAHPDEGKKVQVLDIDKKADKMLVQTLVAAALSGLDDGGNLIVEEYKKKITQSGDEICFDM